MKTRFCIRRGQTTAEYAVVIGVVIAAVVAMQVYVKRSLQAKTADATNYLASQETNVTGNLTQYEPYYVDSSYQVSQDTASTDQFSTGGTVSRTGISETTTRETGGSTKTTTPRTE